MRWETEGGMYLVQTEVVVDLQAKLMGLEMYLTKESLVRVVLE